MAHQLVEFLTEKYRPHVIVLAGSRANGIYTADSDLELLSGLVKVNGSELTKTVRETVAQLQVDRK